MVTLRTIRTRRWLTWCSVGTVALAACSGGGGGGGGGGGDGGGAAGADAMLDVLAAVPAAAAEGSEVTVSYVDLDVVYARAGLGDDATADDRFDALNATADVDTYVIPPPLFGQYSAQRDEAIDQLGFDVTAVARGVEVAAPPRPVTAVVVDVPVERVTAAAQADPTWSDLLTVRDVGGGVLLDWGDELHFDRAGPLHPIGDGGQMLLRDDQPVSMVRTRERSSLDAAIDLERAASLASTGWATEIARLIGGDIIQFVAVPNPAHGVSGTASLDPYDAIVAVESITGSTTAVDVLLVYGDDDAAAANVAAARTYASDATLPNTGRPVAEVLPSPTVSRSGPTVRIQSDGAGRFARLVGALLAGDLFPS